MAAMATAAQVGMAMPGHSRKTASFQALSRLPIGRLHLPQQLSTSAAAVNFGRCVAQGGEDVSVGESRSGAGKEIELSVQGEADVVYSKCGGTEVGFRGERNVQLKEDYVAGREGLGGEDGERKASEDTYCDTISHSKDDSTNDVKRTVRTHYVPQNEDLPPVLPKRKKKPFLTPVKHGSHQRRLKARAARKLPPKKLKAPENGMLVKELIPVAYTVLKAREVLLDGVARLLRQVPVKACRWCSEVHVSQQGHYIRTCQGKNSSSRYAAHHWIPAYLDDIVMPIESFHLADRLQKPIRHDQRFDIDRIPAIVELCIQAGVDLPEYPTLRRTSPFIPPRAVVHELDSTDEGKLVVGLGNWRNTSRGAQQVTADEETPNSAIGTDSLEGRNIKDPLLASEGMRPEEGLGDSSFQEDNKGRSQGQAKSVEEEVATINDEDDLQTMAEKTLQAWETMRSGAAQLMRRYPVRACGYCPEVHVGRRGHKTQLCGAFKHQWRNGQHGWQDASLDDLIPPRYVWHVRDKDGPPLVNDLKNLYGQAPAVVELCLQAGAKIREEYRPRLRLDVIIPNTDEFEMVA